MKMSGFCFVVLLASSLILPICVARRPLMIDGVDDSYLVRVLAGEKNVVVLFTKSGCDECDNLAFAVDGIKKELKDQLDAVVVRAHNSHMVGLYNPAKEPALVYFREGVPLLYYGKPSGDQIVHFFSENKVPIVRELSDINFEHLTQAATGATTGDWFLFFYSTDCVLCLRLYAVWEAVGARLKHRLNVARIDRMGAGVATGKRFGVVESPEFIFIRQGKFYRYRENEYTISSLTDFAENGFMKQTSPETVPPESSDIYTILTDYINSIEKNSQILILSVSGVLLIFILGCVIKYVPFKRRVPKPTHTVKKSK